jgi:transcriptional regulator with XRE-family HTH domain
MAVRKARKNREMTQEELAHLAGVSGSYIRSIEGGLTSISTEVKQGIAKALGYSVWALFPDVEVKVDLFNILVARHGHGLIIRDAEVAIFKEVLSQMIEDEFEELISSGTTPADVHRVIRAWAKGHNIEVIEKN